MFSSLRSMHLDLNSRLLRLNIIFLYLAVDSLPFEILPQCLEVKFIFKANRYIPYFNVIHVHVAELL